MKTFKLNNLYSVSCEFEETKEGFRHTANLLKNGVLIGEETIVNYLNRTWECFEFETVLKKCIDNHFEGVDHKKLISLVKRTM
jgi:hypothetical protein